MSHIPLIAILVIALYSQATGAVAQIASASGIRYVAPTVAQGPVGRVRDGAHVEVRGRITSESPQQLLDALREAQAKPDAFTLGGQPVIKVFLDSPGGNVAAGMAMGRLVRQFAAEIWIDRDEVCASACILVLAGGVSRWAVPTAQLLIHRPVFEQSMFSGLTYEDAQRKYNSLSLAVRDYLRGMGVSDDLYHVMMKIPSNDMSRLDNRLASQMSLLGKDPAHEEWERARAVTRQGREAIEALDRYVKCMNLGVTEDECFRRARTVDPNLK